MQRPLAEASEPPEFAVDEFIALAAHDLRGPMRNVQIIAQMLLEDFHDHGDGKIELIKMLDDIGAKASALISDILSHAHAKAAPSDTTVFNLSDLCSDIFLILDPFKQHTYQVTDRQIYCDRTAIQIILRNLIENALKHAGRDSVAITLDVAPSKPGMLQFRLSDNGRGFKDPALVFLNGGKLRVDSGFGLLGVRQLVRSRGGVIAAENAPDGQGGIVSFTMYGELSM